jgi:hypothetical protein
MTEPIATLPAPQTKRTHARLLPPALFIASAVTFAALIAYRVYGALHGNSSP